VVEAAPRSSTVLVVDDEPDIRSVICRACQREGMRVHEAATAEEAFEAMEAVRPDLVVLDLSLPGTNGLDVCREIRRSDPAVPIIIVTARSEEIDKVIGLELGADDYVTKPFGVRELVARIRANLRKADVRRATEAQIDPPSERAVQVGPLLIRLAAREVTLGGRPVTLTRTEFDILQTLAEHMGHVLSREQIVERVWGFTSEGSDRLVDAHIRNLRHKLERNARRPELLMTVRQVGYRLVPPG
jgi:DNA-binding response OmpR family regulator